jgi:hypothetical protein
MVAGSSYSEGEPSLLGVPPAEPCPMSAASTQPARRSKVFGERLRRNSDHMASGSSCNDEYLSRQNRIVALTSPSHATVAFDDDARYWPRLCSPFSTPPWPAP